MPPLLSRFELKYLISPAVAQAMRRRLPIFAQPDGFGDEGHYQLVSLYLDSEDLHLCKQTMRGEKNRFKLRIRSYADDPDEPVFLEIKSRIDGVIHKRRTPVSRSRAASLLHPEQMSRHAENEDVAGLARFVAMKEAVSAFPVLKVKYHREAWEAAGGEPVRVTFDTDLKEAVTHHADFSLGDGEFESVLTDGVILEIKFSERCPSWVQSMIHDFDLQRTSVAKYVLSINHAMSGANPFLLMGALQ